MTFRCIDNSNVKLETEIRGIDFLCKDFLGASRSFGG